MTRPCTPNSPPLMPTMTLSLTIIGALVIGLALLGIAVLDLPDLFAGLGVERHDGGVGLIEE